MIFKIADSTTDSRFFDVNCCGSLAETPVIGRSNEIAKVAKFD
ncbi:hypothetical protein SAMN05428997_13716 [Bosea sp. CRIB-10]|nr:hypothetical protein SAMN05428997_13716 [Bosea sp. CRIB-10]